MASSISGDQARRVERMRLDTAARLSPNSWSSVEIRMIDLSESGFRAHCEARVPPGGGVTLDIPGIGPVDAQVEWQRRDQFGARFVVPIDISRCGWTLVERSHVLADLLVERAQAQQAGRKVAEGQLRRIILQALPIHKDSAA